MSAESNLQASNSPSVPLVTGFVMGVALTCLLGITLLAYLSTIPDQPAAPAYSTITGNLEIDYMYETEPNTAAGGKMPATRVDFYPSYVVVTRRWNNTDRTSLYAVDRLRRFSVREIEEQPDTAGHDHASAAHDHATH
ncbi:MAG: hypothetical protein WDZ59_14470 [Pirellulales bacterium]